ncbi:MAG: hypothetical protein L6Q84_01970 [Polyangiaceae bacterium]|nr:hypothetical protein [Polyangiaceae bacterium]
MKSPVLLALCVAGLLAISCKSKPAEPEAPKPKSKDEFLKVLDKHRDEYVRCEKLRIESSATSARPVETGDGGSSDAGKADAGRADASAGTPVPAAPPAPATAIEYQRCTTDYWKKVKQEMGPFDQAKADEWYGEWRKGVKVE